MARRNVLIISLCFYCRKLSQTLNTRQYAFSAGEFCFLEIRIFAAPVCGIIVPAQEAAGAGHERGFFTDCTMTHMAYNNRILPACKASFFLEKHWDAE